MPGPTHAQSPDPPAAARWAVEVEIDTHRPRLELCADADRDCLPLMRQALRALAPSSGAEFDGLHDAELALTEACANAVRHAYPANARGKIGVSLEAHATGIRAVVRDQGRGMDGRPRPAQPPGGLGLKVIEAIAGDVELHSEPGMGTEIVMELPIATSPDTPAPDEVDLERLVRRLLAVGAAQSELSPTRITEALMAAEIVAREAPGRIMGSQLRVRVERDGQGVTLLLGPLPPGGARDLVTETGVPVLGSIVDRLADAVWEVPPETGRASDGEELAMRFANA